MTNHHKKVPRNHDTKSSLLATIMKMTLTKNQTDFASGFGTDSLENSIQSDKTIQIMVTSWLSHYLSVILSDPFVKKWFGWLMTPVVLAFLMPAILCLFLWGTSLLLYIHRVHKRRLMRKLTEAFDERDIVKAGRHIVAAIYDAQVRIFEQIITFPTRLINVQCSLSSTFCKK